MLFSSTVYLWYSNYSSYQAFCILPFVNWSIDHFVDLFLLSSRPRIRATDLDSWCDGWGHAGAGQSVFCFGFSLSNQLNSFPKLDQQLNESKKKPLLPRAVALVTKQRCLIGGGLVRNGFLHATGSG